MNINIVQGKLVQKFCQGGGGKFVVWKKEGARSSIVQCDAQKCRGRGARMTQGGRMPSP